MESTTINIAPRDARIKLPLLTALAGTVGNIKSLFAQETAAARTRSNLVDILIGFEDTLSSINSPEFIGQFFTVLRHYEETKAENLLQIASKAHGLIFSPEARRWRKQNWDPANQESPLFLGDLIVPEDALIDFSGRITRRGPILLSTQESREAPVEGEMTMALRHSELSWQMMTVVDNQWVFNGDVSYISLQGTYLGLHHNSGDVISANLQFLYNHPGWTFSMTEPHPSTTPHDYAMEGKFGPFNSIYARLSVGEDGRIDVIDRRTGAIIWENVEGRHSFYTCDNPNTTIAHGGTFREVVAQAPA